MRRFQYHQRGLTLLEVLIALSIFSMIGVASFQVLTTVSETQKVTEQHSRQLVRLQKAMALLDADLQQLVSRDVRVAGKDSVHWLETNNENYVLELTRGGWSNPLQLSRSDLQRVAYDIGPHPRANDADSAYYQQKTRYLRRHYWRVLDRTQGSVRVTQAVLADIDAVEVSVLSDKGRFQRWPKADAGKEEPVLKGIQLTLQHTLLGELTRLYRVQ